MSSSEGPQYEAHRSKMEYKKAARKRRPGPSRPALVPANLGKGHPDYGKPRAVHLTNKEKRNG